MPFGPIAINEGVLFGTTQSGGNAFSGTLYRMAVDGSDFAINLSNARTYSSSVFDAIRKAMNGREKFFRENMKAGVFKNISTIAAKYPGLNLK